MNHKSHRKCKVQRSAGLRQDWNTVAEWAWPALFPPFADRLLIQFVGTFSHGEGKFLLVLVGFHGAYGAQSIGIILLWVDFPQKLTLLAVKLNITPSDKIYSLLPGHFIRYTCLDPLLPLFFVLHKGGANIPQIYKHFMYNKHFYGIFCHIHTLHYYMIYYTLYLHYTNTL